MAHRSSPISIKSRQKPIRLRRFLFSLADTGFTVSTWDSLRERVSNTFIYSSCSFSLNLGEWKCHPLTLSTRLPHRGPFTWFFSRISQGVTPFFLNIFYRIFFLGWSGGRLNGKRLLLLAARLLLGAPNSWPFIFDQNMGNLTELRPKVRKGYPTSFHRHRERKISRQKQIPRSDKNKKENLVGGKKRKQNSMNKSSRADSSSGFFDLKKDIHKLFHRIWNFQNAFSSSFILLFLEIRINTKGSLKRLLPVPI